MSGIITNFTPAQKALAYADEIDALAKAQSEHGENAAYALVQKGVHNTESGAWEYPTTELTKFQNTARAKGHSAKVVEFSVDEDKHVATRIIQLAERRTRKPKDAKVESEAS